MTPLRAYVRSRQLDLAGTLAGKKAIYLDIKFWIILRDVVLGKRTSATEKQLLSLLRLARLREIAFCPISESTFIELLKRADPISRSVSARLMDELSSGVSLIPFDMRAGTELAHFLYSARDSGSVHRLEELVWTKIAYVLGFQHPMPHGLPAQEAEMLQKAFFDHLWSLSLEDMIFQLGDKALPPLDLYTSLADRLNTLNVQHAEEIRSFVGAYKTEVEGVLDVFGEISAEIIENMVREDFDPNYNPSPEERAETTKQIHHVLFQAFQRDETKTALRSLHVLASLHAAVRWDRKRRLQKNDFLDFQHAAGALGYCDAFFTEVPLRSLLTAHHIALDKQFSCHVVATPEEAVLYLQRLLAV